jgi:N-acetylneuraminic acid mutarotase
MLWPQQSRRYPDYLNTFEIYNSVTDTWSVVKKLPFYVEAAVAVVLNGRIYIICGYLNGQQSSSVYEYIP